MMRRRSTHACSMMRAFHVCVLLAVFATTAVVARTEECCDQCIGKTTKADYDPLLFDQCGDKSFTGRVCCFNCGAEQAAAPQFENVEYVDGTTPQVKAGEWIQITWSKMARVTYEPFQKSQAKTVTVKNASAEATLENGVFFICAKNEGMVVVRGWGTDTCTSATYEATVKVAAGSGGGTCAERTPSAPSGGSTNSNQASNPELASCNLQRASIVKVNGNDTCVCASEWTGAPECSGYPWWKILVTVGGGIAAVLSIAVSVKAFMNSRKAKQAEAERVDKNDAILGEESITIAGGHNSRAAPNNYHDNYLQQQQPIYHQHPATVKAQDNKEYSL